MATISLTPLLLDDISLEMEEGSVPYSEEEAAQRYYNLSYSSLSLLHDCPRKFQLYRLIPHAAREQSIHFTYGHAVGEGMQMLFGGASIEDITLKMFMGWDMPLDFVDQKAQKSFWHAILAIQNFSTTLQVTDLANWEPVYWEGNIAAELGFRLQVGNYYYRGFIDLVIRNKHTGEIAVLECKTTGAKYLNAATYGNSSQALSYSLPLDQIFPDLSSYKVIYLVYMTEKQDWEVIPFEKHAHQRAKFIRDLIYEVRDIEMYKEADSWPERGSACVSFNRVCGFYGTCGQSTRSLAPVLPPLHNEEFKYQFTFDLLDIIERQLENADEIV